MNERIKKLRNKSLLNIILFFIEFFVLSSIFKSSLKGGSLFNLLSKIFPLLNKDILLVVSLFFMLSSVSIRYVYAKYLNKSIDQFEKVVNNIDEINKNKCKNIRNNYDKKSVKENDSYDELKENYNDYLFLDEEQEHEKGLVKVYKR